MKAANQTPSKIVSDREEYITLDHDASDQVSRTFQKQLYIPSWGLGTLPLLIQF